MYMNWLLMRLLRRSGILSNQGYSQPFRLKNQ
jgi:hypothetical protein